MAKISGLPVADQVDGSEMLPIVQHGQSKRSTLAAIRDLVIPFVQNYYKGDRGDTGTANNTYTSYAALQASDPTRMYAYLVGDTDQPPRPDGPYSNPSASPAGWVPQSAGGIRCAPRGAGTVARSLQEEHDDLAIRPEAFGAIGNMLADDTIPIQRAMDSGLSIELAHGKTYLVTGRLDWSASNVALRGGGTIRVAADWDFAADMTGDKTHMRMLFITGANVTINGIVFDLRSAPEGSAVENGVIWSTGPFTKVTNCQFIGNPKGTCIWAMSAWADVSLNNFDDCSGAVFFRGRNAMCLGNIVKDAFDAAIALNAAACVGAVVTGNTITNEAGRLIPAMIAVEEGASSWSITGNTLLGVNGGGIWCGNVVLFEPADGGVIANNTLSAYLPDGKLPVSANPATMLFISPYYVGWVCTGNKVLGCPTGNTDSCLAQFPATKGVFVGNLLDGRGRTGLSAHVRIQAGTGGLTIRDNLTLLPHDDSRHYLASAGDYGDAPVLWKGNEFEGGLEGINTDLNAPLMVNFVPWIDNLTRFTDVATPTAMAAALGSRSDFINAGAWQRPHLINGHTDMFCSGTPQASGDMAFQNGDRFHFMDPADAGALTLARVAGGTPWRKFGPLVP